ncbi:hypothetical protein HY626_03090 [Candidatus Uhrbacteria bacterium]|nr:hypothetical protein [Candidatus Uhrbacteria bacterium]
MSIDEDTITRQVTGGDVQKRKNFRVTRMYDMLTRVMAGYESTHLLQKARVELYRGLIKEELAQL